MKKFILRISVITGVLLLLNCGGNDNDSGKMIEIPDPNFKAFLLEKYDKNKDGQISFAEAKKVKTMDCSGRNIKDLSGIWFFVNLKSLDCSNNALDEVILYNNKKVNRLACKNNNDEFKVYFGMSGALTNKAFKKPAANTEPNVASVVSPIDLKKCSYDKGTIFYISFDH